MRRMALRFRTRQILKFLIGVFALWLGWKGLHLLGPTPAKELARLVPGHRPLLARSSIATAYAPFDPAAPPVGPDEREAIYAKLLGAKAAGLSGARDAIAVFYAFRDEPGDVERALRDVDDPVDRGGVLLARDRPDEALEEFAKALSARPKDPAALFNRALALDVLLLDGQAAAAWDAYLAVDAESGWANEARQRKDAPRTVPAEQGSLDVVKSKTLRALLAAKGPDDLPAIRPAADALEAVGDRLIARSLEFLAGLDAHGWVVRAEELRKFGTAREQIAVGRDAGIALQSLAQSADPLLAVKSLHFLAYGALLRDDVGQASDALERLRNLCQSLGCTEEIALVASDLGNLHHRSGHFQEAARAYEEGARILPAGFQSRRSEILYKLAVVSVDQAALERGADIAREALRTAVDAGGKPNPRLLAFTASVLARLGRRAAAEAFGREAVERTAYSGGEADALQISREQAARLAAWGREAEALELLERTIDRARGTDLDASRASALAQLARLQLQTGRVSEAGAAIEEARRLAGSGGDPAYWANVRETEGRIAAKSGRLEVAAAAFREAVRIERTLAGNATDPLARRRIELAGAGRRLLLAATLGDAGDPAGALRAFLGGEPAPLLPGECRIGFGAIDDRLLVFTAHGGGASFQAAPLPESVLKRAIDDGARGSIDRLGQLLGSAWGTGRCPDEATRIAILEPPGAVAAPLAILVRRERPRVLVGVATAPDSRWPERVAEGATWLVRDPLLPVGEARPRLPGTDHEEAALRAFRRDLQELRGAEATPAGVRDRVGDAALLHFAVHAESRTGAGPSSYLVLGGEKGHLEVARILELKLRQKPLVVLSACNAAGAPENVENDASGLPWAFLRAGASAVIAPLDVIGDADAAAFSATFYRLLSSSASVAHAFADASSACGEVASCGAFVFYF